VIVDEGSNGAVEPALLNVLLDAPRHLKRDWFAGPDAAADVRGRDADQRDVDDAYARRRPGHAPLHLGQVDLNAGPAGDGYFRLLNDPGWIFPKMEFAEGIGAHDKDEIGSIVAAAQFAQGVDGEGRTGTFEINWIDHDVRAFVDGERKHRQPILRRAQPLIRLVRRVSRRDEEDARQAQDVQALGCNHKMTHVNRIEGSAKNPDSIPAHGLLHAPSTIRFCSS
jgi:hypothetical protein